MTGIIRSWQCKNARCNCAFESWEPNPACPKCQCVRVGWIPGGGHIAGTAAACDADLRALADCFRLTDMNSGEEGRGAKKVRLPDAPAPNSGPVHTFAPGFSAAVNPQAGATCVPTNSKVDFKVKTGTGNKFGPGALGLPGVRANTAVEATHKP